VEKKGSAAGLRVRELLMDMRRYRMGLVQTYDQLRFSYLAIIEGIKRIVRVPSLDSGFENNSEVCCVGGLTIVLLMAVLNLLNLLKPRSLGHNAS